MPIIDEVASLFRQTSPEEDVEVIGVVKKLEHMENSGKVTIVGTADGEGRTVVMDLSGVEHKMAIRAYDERLVMVCHGELNKEGKGFVLHNPRGLMLIEE
jgi:hypothetical protein